MRHNFEITDRLAYHVMLKIVYWSSYLFLIRLWLWILMSLISMHGQFLPVNKVEIIVLGFYGSFGESQQSYHICQFVIG